MMKHKMISMLLLACLLPMAGAAKEKQKTIDNGGSGAYKAVATEERTFKDAVVYRPVDMKAAVKAEGALPVLVWANGGCNDTSLPHERMLGEVASRGYIVIALGSMQERIDDRPLKKSPNEQMNQAMDWIAAQAKKKGSAYYGMADATKIAVAGQSCGGAQALVASADERVKTTVMVNSGMGDIEMSGASRQSLDKLHAPILYMPGGESDIAYANAVKDYARINHVFAAFANHLTAGHGGDFDQQYGGSFARMLTAWLDWQLKGKADCADIFRKGKMDGFPEWTMKSKDTARNFVFEPFTVMEAHVKSHKGQDIFGKIYLPSLNYQPSTLNSQFPFAILCHGYNSSTREVEAYAECLAMQGIASYAFDFCGGSVNSRSEGKTTEMSVFTEADDVAAVVETVSRWSFVDTKRLALLGCSQGGLVAAIASSQMPDAFKTVVLVYPALLIGEHAVNVHPQEARTSSEGVEVMGMKLSHIYYDKLVGYHIFDEMPKYKGPVMIVYGDKDPIAAGDYMERARKTYRECEVNVIPGGAHGFPASPTHVQANDAIVKYLKKTLVPERRSRIWNDSFQTETPMVHDPVMAKDGDTYYLYATGMGIQQMTSKDRKTWTMSRQPVMTVIPGWTTDSVPGFGNHVWAPDVIKWHGRWWLAYSCSTFGRNGSAIGLLSSHSLAANLWKDEGCIVTSREKRDNWNAIDPNFVIDEATDTPWMVWGSFWDGIQIVRLDSTMHIANDERPHTIARRYDPNYKPTESNPTSKYAGTNAIEAPFIFKHGGYYYLFVSWDYCCRGAKSNYRVAVGRSKTVDGPYLDRSGKDMVNGGGTLFLEGDKKQWEAAGHCAAYTFEGEDIFICHGYSVTQNGAALLIQCPISWTADGWPELKSM